MAIHPYKLDLPRFGCGLFQMDIDITADESAVEAIDAYLANGVAWDSYRRSGERHTAVLQRSHSDDPGSGEIASYFCMWFISQALPAEAPEGSLQEALDSVRGIEERNAEIHAHCRFSVDSSDMQPRVTLPIKLFSPGSFAFNQIHGYRAAFVDGDRTVWSAVVDWPGSSGEYEISVHVNDCGTDPAPSSVFRKCVEVRDGLMTERGNG